MGSRRASSLTLPRAARRGQEAEAAARREVPHALELGPQREERAPRLVVVLREHRAGEEAYRQLWEAQQQAHEERADA